MPEIDPLLTDIKEVLRISGSDLDNEIGDLISASICDLMLSGITNYDTEDPLIKRAVVLYCKANFGWDNPEADRFQKSYDMLKAHLTMSSDYVV